MLKHRFSRSRYISAAFCGLGFFLAAAGIENGKFNNFLQIINFHSSVIFVPGSSFKNSKYINALYTTHIAILDPDLTGFLQ
jgi:hypothetical protein